MVRSHFTNLALYSATLHCWMENALKMLLQRLLKPRGIINQLPSPGFWFTLISIYAFSSVSYVAFLSRCIPTFNDVVLQQTRVFTRSFASTAARDSIQIDRPPCFNEGLHLDFGMLQCSKMVLYKIVYVQKTLNKTR